jgi:DNA primase large subunit
MARTEFNWTLNLISESLDGRLYNFGLHFGDYLRNAAVFREPKWKLVNRQMRDGYVILTQQEAVRLLKEEVQRKIYGFVSTPARLNLPEPLRERTNRLAKLLSENRARLTGEDLPSEVVMDALPPCIKHAYEGLMTGKRLSHMERFGLASFLINAGMAIDDIVKLFISVTDFDEDFTRYQIEHIAGLRGSRTKYTPPTCSTLRTHGVCVNPDRICERIKHPLSYYRRRIWMMEREREERQGDVNPQIEG